MRGYQTKRITLPGGKVVEIVFFTDVARDVVDAGDPSLAQVAREADAAAEAASVPELHVCPECQGELVFPVAWEERSADRWSITRRCPDCEWWGTGEFADQEVEAFDDVLNDGTEALLKLLQRVARANMEEDVDRLIFAIQAEHIQPIDF